MGRITVLDGGMGHLIKDWGVSIPGLPYEQQFLAGCLALHAAPETISRAHAAYIDVGCDVITTNNFAATIHNLSKVQKESQWLEYCKVRLWHHPSPCSFTCDHQYQTYWPIQSWLVQEAGHLARQTADSSSRTVLVAGCLPPLQERCVDTMTLTKSLQAHCAARLCPAHRLASLACPCHSFAKSKHWGGVDHCCTMPNCSYQVTNLPDAASLRAQYTDIARALQPNVDIFLAETLCTVAEAQAALDAAAQAAPGGPVFWHC